MQSKRISVDRSTVRQIYDARARLSMHNQLLVTAADFQLNALKELNFHQCT
jgi:hypothetical protein